MRSIQPLEMDRPGVNSDWNRPREPALLYIPIEKMSFGVDQCASDFLESLAPTCSTHAVADNTASLADMALVCVDKWQPGRDARTDREPLVLSKLASSTSVFPGPRDGSWTVFVLPAWVLVPNLRPSGASSSPGLAYS